MVERYRETGLGLLQHSGGEYVRFSDYADLQRQLAEARAIAAPVYSRRELERKVAVAKEALTAYDKLERNGISAHDKWNAVTSLVRTALASLEDRA